MKKLMYALLAVSAAVFTVFMMYTADKRTKQVAGYLDSNVFFGISEDNGAKTVTILNEQFKLRY